MNSPNSANRGPSSVPLGKWTARCFGGPFLFALAPAILIGTATASDPHIDLIERYGTNQVTVHFNTDANRTYTLQYSSLTNSGAWSDLFTTHDLFPNHY